MPKKVSITLSPEVGAYLRDLIETGLFGTTPEEVARQLVLDGLKRAITDRLIGLRRFYA